MTSTDLYHSPQNVRAASLSALAVAGLAPADDTALAKIMSDLDGVLRQRPDGGLVVIDQVTGVPNATVGPDGTAADDDVLGYLDRLRGRSPELFQAERAKPVAGLKSEPVLSVLTSTQAERRAADLKRKADAIHGNPWRHDQVNLTRQAAIRSGDPDRAERLRREAGVAR